ncbi:MAG: hypothetical protein IKZ34_03095 [Alphaproteobacteria bacterium]|nr:hypothetical protein [Alphaproteobacteria bacterium]
MKEKIKNLFSFLGRAWSGSIRGKLGILLAIIASFLFIGIFCGNVSVQRVGLNIWHLNKAQEQLDAETEALKGIQHHIQLLQNYSPDYINELGLKYLNIGDPQVKILRY